MPPQNLHLLVDALRQTDRTHHLVNKTDAPARGRLNAGRHFVAQIAPRNYRSRQVLRQVVAVQPRLDPRPSLLQHHRIRFPHLKPPSTGSHRIDDNAKLAMYGKGFQRYASISAFGTRFFTV